MRLQEGLAPSDRSGNVLHRTWNLPPRGDVTDLNNGCESYLYIHNREGDTTGSLNVFSRDTAAALRQDTFVLVQCLWMGEGQPSKGHMQAWQEVAAATLTTTLQLMDTKHNWLPGTPTAHQPSPPAAALSPAPPPQKALALPPLCAKGFVDSTSPASTPTTRLPLADAACGQNSAALLPSNANNACRHAAAGGPVLPCSTAGHQQRRIAKQRQAASQRGVGAA